MESEFNWSFLEKKLNPKRENVKFSSVKHLLKKVAFDVYREINGSDRLWELQEGSDGVQYIVALYDDDVSLTVEAKEKEWVALIDSNKENVTLSYKKTPLIRVNIASHGVSKNKAHSFAAFLETQTQDKKFIESLLNEVPEQKREALIKLLRKEDD